MNGGPAMPCQHVINPTSSHWVPDLQTFRPHCVRSTTTFVTKTPFVLLYFDFIQHRPKRSGPDPPANYSMKMFVSPCLQSSIPQGL